MPPTPIEYNEAIKNLILRSEKNRALLKNNLGTHAIFMNNVFYSTYMAEPFDLESTDDNYKFRIEYESILVGEVN